MTQAASADLLLNRTIDAETRTGVSVFLFQLGKLG
jgi:hypothetical protein